MPAVPRFSYVLTLSAATVVLAILLSWAGWPDPGRSGQFSFLLIAGILASLPALQPLNKDWPTLRLPFVVEFAALVIFGPQPAMLVAACGLLARYLSDERRPRPLWQAFVNAFTIMVSLQAAAWANRALGGTTIPLMWPWHAGPMTAAVFAYCVVTSASAELLVPLLRRRGLEGAWRDWPKRVLQKSPVYFVAAAAAIAVVEMLVRHQWVLLAVAAGPLYLAYRIYCDLANRIERQHGHTQDLESRVTRLRHETTEHARAAEEIQRQGERLGLAAEVANDGLWEWDLSTEQFYATGRWKAMLGLPADAEISTPWDWLGRVHGDDIEPLKDTLRAHLAGQTEYVQHEHRIRHEDGTYRFFQCRGVAHGHHIAGSLTDTTDLAITQERLHNAVFLDSLTGLCNRAVFVEELGRRLKEFKRRRGRDPFALLYLDLDRFKVVNDSLGHLVGDELLVAVSRRLESCLRDGDVLARLGGDEFAILLNGLQTAQQANVVAFRVQEALSKPFSIGGREVFTSASIGIAFGHAQYSTPDEMMHDADTAMYQAKTHGKARHEVFDADMDARARDRLGLENDLRRAIGAGDFEVHYQPIVSLATAMCVGFESLVRWSRNGKPVSPALFIPIAEELGLIEALGTRVLEDACRTFAAWQRKFPHARLECITVNVSCRQLMQQNFVSVVQQAVRQARLRPSALRIEITETALMTSPDVAARVLSDLRRFGVKIYLDDFGTGYSSLSHLHKLPVDALKIDRSFVRSLSLPDRPAIVESILALARTLDTSVVAEGIETETQARELERLGCTHAQGYLFSRPVPAGAAEKILLANVPLGPKGVEQSATAAAC
jgi:diguanylate cyclase (GGDEF)-like protein